MKSDLKILFLDNDGVICLSTEWGGRFKKQRKAYTKENPMPIESELPIDLRFDDFNKKAVKILNEIIEKTSCEIVVSSDWKLYATLEELGDYYESQGIAKRPIDCTLNLEEFEKDADMYSREKMRILEIKKYLEDHPDIFSWVAVDDMDMSNKAHGGSGLENFVRTPRSNEGIKQSGIHEKIINLLK